MGWEREWDQYMKMNSSEHDGDPGGERRVSWRGEKPIFREDESKDATEGLDGSRRRRKTGKMKTSWACLFLGHSFVFPANPFDSITCARCDWYLA